MALIFLLLACVIAVAVLGITVFLEYGRWARRRRLELAIFERLQKSHANPRLEVVGGSSLPDR
jgi:hypothetical protein